MAHRTTATITMRVTVAGRHPKGIDIARLFNKQAVFQIHSMEQKDIETKNIGEVDHAIKEINFLKNFLLEVFMNDPLGMVWYQNYGGKVTGRKRPIPSLEIFGKIFIYQEDGCLVVDDKLRELNEEHAEHKDPVKFELALEDSIKSFVRHLVGLTNIYENKRIEIFHRYMEENRRDRELKEWDLKRGDRSWKSE